MVWCKKVNTIYRRSMHLCRVNSCEYWGECRKEIERTGYKLLPSNHPYAIDGLQWKRIKKDVK